MNRQRTCSTRAEVQPIEKERRSDHPTNSKESRSSLVRTQDRFQNRSSDAENKTRRGACGERRRGENCSHMPTFASLDRGKQRLCDRQTSGRPHCVDRSKACGTENDDERRAHRLKV